MIGAAKLNTWTQRTSGGGWTPADLSNLVTLNRVGVDRAAGRLWQNRDKTVPATEYDEDVVVASLPVATPTDFVGEYTPLQLQVDGAGLWSLRSRGKYTSRLDGPNLRDVITGSDDYHLWAWASLTSRTTAQFIFATAQDGGFFPYLTGCALMNGDGANPGLNSNWPHVGGAAGDVPAVNEPFLIQCWRESGTGYLQTNNGTVYSAPDSQPFGQLLTVANGPFVGGMEAGSRIFQWGVRSVAPSPIDRANLYAAGPGA